MKPQNPKPAPIASTKPDPALIEEKPIPEKLARFFDLMDRELTR